MPPNRRNSASRTSPKGAGRHAKPGPRAKATPKPNNLAQLLQAAAALRNFALTLPGATEEYPWGERVVKVGGKVFIFLGCDAGSDKETDAAPQLSFSVKLPLSKDQALKLPWCRPTAYGLGKHGWVTPQLPLGKSPPIDTFLKWIEESYRAVAPKRLLAELDEPA